MLWHGAARAAWCRRGLRRVSSACGGTLTLGSTEATEEFGAAVAALARVGDVICLHGDLGAGKSVFARGFIRAFVGDENLAVPSPTFLLDVTYDTPLCTVHHYDLYRLQGPEDFTGLGIEGAMATGVCLFEWPQRLGHMSPADRLDVTLEHVDFDASNGIDSGRRMAQVVPHGQRWSDAWKLLR